MGDFGGGDGWFGRRLRVGTGMERWVGRPGGDGTGMKNTHGA